MQTVFVGLSGGVDSSVSAALLKDAGYHVVGVFIKIWQPEFIECTWREDRLDAMRIAAALGIPFLEMDLSEEYKRDVIDTMISDYSRGMTPNPDVLCNQHIKFGAWYRWARTQGADLVATGHYAQIHNGQLLKGVDAAKDQSYFVHRMSADAVLHTLFPVGGYTKTHVRELALHYDLPNAHKRDSQGLCFVGEVRMKDFLQRYIPVEEGSVRDTHGTLVGTHEGAALYTLGQRQGFSLISSAHQTPQYVVHIDTYSNTLIVSPHLSDAYVPAVSLRDIHWIHEPPSSTLVYDAQARYHEQPVQVRILDNHVTFLTPHLAPGGQSLVLYNDTQCLGGGVVT